MEGLGGMSRTVIDLDDELLERARKILETTTKRDTVTEALRHVVVQQARAELVEWLASGTYTDCSQTRCAQRRGACERPLPR